MSKYDHQQQVIEQFTQQAVAYTAITAHTDALDKIIQMSEVKSTDTVLDVACGSGIVATALAQYAKQVTGIDITPGMIAEAKKLQHKKGLQNMQWQIGNVQPLPYKNEAFNIVVSRFGFHHFPQPEKVFTEMLRVCQPNGHVLVIDVVQPKEKVEAYNKMEKLRDPSHTSVLTQEQFTDLFKKAGLTNIQQEQYRMAIGLQEQLKASFPTAAAKITLQEMIMNDVGINQLGIDAQLYKNDIVLHYPISIFSARKP